MSSLRGAPLDPEIVEALRRDLTIDITTTGRHTGAPRRIEIWFLCVDDRFFITGTPGPRDWYANLLADPAFTFHLKESVTADLPATASPVTDRELRRHVVESAVAAWYLTQVDLAEMVERAPMVEVVFSDSR